jgi:hypothetical protein
MRTRTSSQKRQKEIARMDKQREKAARRMQRKLEPKQPIEAAIESPAPENDPAETERAKENE